MLDKIRQAGEVLSRDGEAAALKFAARLSARVLGPARDPIQRAWSARQSPDTYRDMGADPDALWAAGVAALKELLSEADV